jgi:hypothetical protein
LFSVALRLPPLPGQRGKFGVGWRLLIKRFSDRLDYQRSDRTCRQNRLGDRNANRMKEDRLITDQPGGLRKRLPQLPRLIVAVVAVLKIQAETEKEPGAVDCHLRRSAPGSGGVAREFETDRDPLCDDGLKCCRGRSGLSSRRISVDAYTA